MFGLVIFRELMLRVLVFWQRQNLQMVKNVCLTNALSRILSSCLFWWDRCWHIEEKFWSILEKKEWGGGLNI